MEPPDYPGNSRSYTTTCCQIAPGKIGIEVRGPRLSNWRYIGDEAGHRFIAGFDGRNNGRIEFWTERERTIDLSRYQWESRLLLVFAPSEENTRYRDFRRELRDQEDEIVDRDLLVFHILERGESRLGDISIDRQSAALLRDRFSAKPGQYTVVLIGKDGGEKLRRGDEVNIAETFPLIDSMPMRQREMRKGGREKTP